MAKFALINPNWTFAKSVYFGCRESHLPLEFGYAKSLLEFRGHDALIIDAKFHDLSLGEIRSVLSSYSPEFTIVTTAPTYLFWRCPPPELSEPKKVILAIRDVAGTVIVVGPHASVTPETTLLKCGADAVIRGECEEALSLLADSDWESLSFVHYFGRKGTQACVTRMQGLPPLYWPDRVVKNHTHHHHRFDKTPRGSGAEVESSRGCQFSCSFCSREFFREKYRNRPLSIVIQEIDNLIAQGVMYIYFIDEMFMPHRELLESIEERKIEYGVQTRIDLWRPEMLELLGRSGCVSIEAGIESLSFEGRNALNKHCTLTTEELTDRLILAKKFIPFVQANLIKTEKDNRESFDLWRSQLFAHGVWANDPVPLFPYPGSPRYRELWGEPNSTAWETAHAHYLQQHSTMCDLQDGSPVTLQELERSGVDECKD